MITEIEIYKFANNEKAKEIERLNKEINILKENITILQDIIKLLIKESDK